MPLETKLRQWQDAGLLDAATVARIREHEAAQRKPYGVYAVGGIGGFTVAVGLVAIVASNWDAIPGSVKLGVDLLLLAALGWAVTRLRESRLAWLHEAVIVLHYGAVLASVGLVSQVYQLGGATWQALAIWTLLTTPLVWHANSRFVATTWIVGTQVAIGTALAALAESRSDALAVALCHPVAVATLCLGVSKTIARRKPEFADALCFVGLGEVLLSATVGTIAFYEGLGFSREPSAWWGVALSVLLTAAAAREVSRFPLAPRARALALVTLATALLLGQGPFFLSRHADFPILAAASCIGFWALVGFTAYRAGSPRLVNLATAVIGVRILIAYFELFGSLLNTGIALVLGGALVLGLLALWLRYKRDVDRRLDPARRPAP